MSDLIERLRAHAALHRGIAVDDDDEQAQWAQDLLTAADEIERLTAELETERMRLAACGVVALANTQTSAAKAREMLPEYRSASLTGVERAVDREMKLRAERDEARAERDALHAVATDAHRDIDELRRQLAEAGESIAAQARTIADLRGALIESREMIRVDRESLYETSVNPDGAIDCEDDRKALAEYDDHLDYIAQVLGECVPAAMDITRPAEEA